MDIIKFFEKYEKYRSIKDKYPDIENFDFNYKHVDYNYHEKIKILHLKKNSGIEFGENIYKVVEDLELDNIKNFIEKYNSELFSNLYISYYHLCWDGNCGGYYNQDNDIIFLNLNSQFENRIEQILSHEIGHFLWNKIGFKIDKTFRKNSPESHLLKAYPSLLGINDLKEIFKEMDEPSENDMKYINPYIVNIDRIIHEYMAQLFSNKIISNFDSNNFIDNLLKDFIIK